MNLIKPSFSTGYAKNASESANPNLWKGLVGAWMPSFGVTGGTLKDVSGNGNDGTLTNMDAATDWVATSKGLALDFDGVDDYATCGNTNDALASFTLSIWFKSSSLSQTNKGLFGKWGSNATQNRGYMLWLSSINSGKLSLVINGQPHYAGTSDIRVGGWRHLAGTFDGANGKIFVDGKVENSFTDSQPLSSSSDFLLGAYYDNSNVFQEVSGQLAFAKVYNRALSPTEIKQLYTNPSAPFQKKTTTVVSVPVAPPTLTAKAVVLKKPKPSYATGYARNASESANPNLWKGLVGAWMPSFGVTGNTLKDVSGNGNDGTLTNAYWGTASNLRSLIYDGTAIVQTTFNDQLQDFTANVWFYGYTLTSAGTDRLLDKAYNTGFWMGSAYPYSADSFGGGILQTNAPYGLYIGGFSPSRLNMLTMTRKGNVQTVIRDGGKQSASQTVNSASLSSVNLSIGKAGIRPFNGAISNATIYNRVLSPTEIKQLYLNPAAPFERKQQTVEISTAQAFNPYWANQATQLAGTLQ